MLSSIKGFFEKLFYRWNSVQNPAPKFLLPATAVKFRELRARVEFESFRRAESMRTKAIELRAEARSLATHAARLQKRASRIGGAEAELMRRDSNQYKDRARELFEQVNVFVGMARRIDMNPRMAPESFDPVEHTMRAGPRGVMVAYCKFPLAHEWARTEARRWEWNKILSEGRVLASSTKDPLTDSRPGPSWDLIERRIVALGDRIFVAEIRTPALTIEHLPTGRCSEPVVEWVTDSLGQMTRDELHAIAAYEARVKKQ